MNTKVISGSISDVVSNFFMAALVALTFIAATPASARSIDPTPVVAILSVPDNASFKGVDSLVLLADGRVQMVLGKTLVGTIFITQPTKDALLETARDLSSAKVLDQKMIPACTAVFPKELSELAVAGFDVTTGTFDSQTRTVLTSDNCDRPRVVRPESDTALKLGQELRAQLQIIFLQTVP